MESYFSQCVMVTVTVRQFSVEVVRLERGEHGWLRFGEEQELLATQGWREYIRGHEET